MQLHNITIKTLEDEDYAIADLWRDKPVVIAFLRHYG